MRAPQNAITRPNFAVCDEAFQLAHNDYQQALNVAQALGYNFLAGQMQKLCRVPTPSVSLHKTRDATSKTFSQQPAAFSARRRRRTC
jgi:hypothetical protein